MINNYSATKLTWLKMLDNLITELLKENNRFSKFYLN